jgi:hypothetical protein
MWNLNPFKKKPVDLPSKGEPQISPLASISFNIKPDGGLSVLFDIKKGADEELLFKFSEILYFINNGLLKGQIAQSLLQMKDVGEDIVQMWMIYEETINNKPLISPLDVFKNGIIGETTEDGAP